MEKKLPEMFVNKVDKNIGNNNNVFCSYKEERSDITENVQSRDINPRNINQKIKDIFNSPNYVYKADVELTVNGETLFKTIVGRNSIHLITIDNELIPISDITDIKRK